MASDIEITKRNLLSESQNLRNRDSIAIEDARFLTFTSLLYESDYIQSPIISRRADVYKNLNWSLIGYSCESSKKINFEDEEDDFDLDLNGDDNEGLSNNLFNEFNNLDFSYDYIIFNGFFTENIELNFLSQNDIIQKINESINF